MCIDFSAFHDLYAQGTDDSASKSLLVPLLPALVDGLVNMSANFSGSAEILRHNFS